MMKTTKSFVRKILSLTPELLKAVQLIYSSSRYDFLLHLINLRLCQVCYRFSHFFTTIKNKNGYIFFENSDLDTVLSSISDHMKENIEKERKAIKVRANGSFSQHVKLTNYSFVTFPDHKQQLHFDHIPTQLLKKLEFSLERSGIFNKCSTIVNTKFTVSQMRAWLFFPNYNDNKDRPVDKHRDGLPPGTIKIMFYQGNFTESLPALKLHLSSTKNVMIKGVNPILIFNSNEIEHEASFPSKIRPSIEITLTPSITNSYRIMQAGYMAGAKYNPFLKSSADISIMLSK